MADIHLLLYRYVENMVERRTPYRPDHLAHIKAAQAAGQIGIAGATGDPPTGGAFQFIGLSEGEIKDYVHADPYYQAGLIVSFEIQPWTLV